MQAGYAKGVFPRGYSPLSWNVGHVACGRPSCQPSKPLMHMQNTYWEKLEADLADTSGVIVPKGKDEEEYFEELRSSIREHAAAPDLVSATVKEPGFKHRALGSIISGYLLAKSGGYWLVFEPDESEYYCFWGTDPNELGAYGVFGNPLYCWWD